MANPTTNGGGDVFDIRRVRRLVELMRENELTELDIQQGEMRIQLKRNASVPTMSVTPMTVPVPAVVPVAAAPPKETPPPKGDDVHVIKSPMVGTFYMASSPDAPPFVKVGDSVSPEKTVCLIEAMKVYNEIQAECSGKILAVLVSNGQAVEFGAPLFKVSMG